MVAIGFRGYADHVCVTSASFIRRLERFHIAPSFDELPQFIRLSGVAQMPCSVSVFPLFSRDDRQVKTAGEQNAYFFVFCCAKEGVASSEAVARLRSS
jgi:hypothetical protein